MRLVFTTQAQESLIEALKFLSLKVSDKKLAEVRERVLKKAETLIKAPYSGQKEIYLEHLGKEHRRLISGHFKIIYRVESDIIYITDIFDSRQSPEKMKG